MFRKISFFVGGLFILTAAILSAVSIWQDTALAKVVDTYTHQKYILPDQTSPVSSPTTTVSETSTLEEGVVVTPTLKERTVFGYLLNGEIDLSSGDPIALEIWLPDGGVLQTNWAGTASYKADDDLEKVFSPDQGIVYSYESDVTTTWAHSGRTTFGQEYFATRMDDYLRKNAENSTVSLAEANEKAAALKGATAFLCQVDPGEVRLLADYAEETCPGKVIELEVTAAVVIPHERLVEYEAAVMNVNQWLSSNYPDAGFDQLNNTDGWLISFCVGKLADQTSDGSPWYLYNRGVIGFRIKDGSS